MKRDLLYVIYFFLPFFIWLWIYIQKPDLIVVFKRPPFEKSVIMSIEDFWQIILVFAVFQLGNDVLMRLLKDYKIFSKIQLIFIFCHLVVAFYLLILNFF